MWNVTTDLAFLLLDDPNEAKQVYSDRGREWLRMIIMNGRKKKIQNWDLKVLSAIYLSIRAMSGTSISKTNYEHKLL